MGALILLSIIVVSLVVLALATVWLFRRGMRGRFVTDAPFGRLALFTICTQLLMWLYGWITSDPDAKTLLHRVAVGCTLFLLGIGAWLMGFMYNRWRKRRAGGILQSRY